MFGWPCFAFFPSLQSNCSPSLNQFSMLVAMWLHMVFVSFLLVGEFERFDSSLYAFINGFMYFVLQLILNLQLLLVRVGLVIGD